MNGWDDLEGDAKAASTRRSGCGVAEMLELINEEHGEDAHESVIRTLRNHRLTTSSIHKALESRVEPDYLPSAYTLGRHRRGACNCSREWADE